MSFRISDLKEIAGLRVTVMGLGLNGGGVASARFFAEHGAAVTATDLRDERTLAPSLEQLSGLPIRFVLGGHEAADFSGADIVIKNPSVRRDSPFLALAPRVETDLTVFLSLCRNPIVAVTGSKGKSTTVSAIHHVLVRVAPGARLGGNITVSPLTFLDTLDPADPVVLELSSWQLADLRDSRALKPTVALITNIMPDHQNMYSDMDEYAADKRAIYAEQDRSDWTLLNYTDRYTESFAAETKGTVRYFSPEPLPEKLDGAFLDGAHGMLRTGTELVRVVPEELAIRGEHHRLNLLSAALALVTYGVPAGTVAEGLRDFPGIEHRLERVAEKRGVTFYNDSAATIPQAAAAAVKSFACPVVLITGGTDKSLEFESFLEAAHIPKKILLLEGTATDKLIPVLKAAGIGYLGPYDNLTAAFERACAEAESGDAVLLSPGAASFGMFLNEFDRGNRFKALVRALPD